MRVGGGQKGAFRDILAGQ